jgi:hypothetical protein
VGGVHGASGHVATLEPFPSGWRALCHGARGDTGALLWRVSCSVPRGMWQSQSPLAPGMDLAQGYLICRVPTHILHISLNEEKQDNPVSQTGGSGFACNDYISNYRCSDFY